MSQSEGMSGKEKGSKLLRRDTKMASTASQFTTVARLLDDAVERRVFPCATIEVGGRGGAQWSHACGALTYDDEAAPATLKTVFDLASLTKVIVTTTLIMRLVDTGAIRLDDPVNYWADEWRGADRVNVTVADLLEHASGLAAHLPFFRDHSGTREFEHEICTLPLDYMPRSRSVYSDLGFILLAFLVRRAGQGAGIDYQFHQLAQALGFGELRYSPPAAWRPRIAPTEVDPWRGRLLRGEVHDENGWALGGVAGHTGLFGTVPAVGRFASALLETLNGAPLLARPATLSRFLRHSRVPGSSRALGWDTMLVTSSCGHRLSSDAIGHTGFTGTSLWIDPRQDLYVVLLSNRVHPTRTNEAILDVRSAVHDAVVEALDAG
jgi:CubicO group peptidase (beta-lactamase class C family)